MGIFRRSSRAEPVASFPPPADLDRSHPGPTSPSTVPTNPTTEHPNPAAHHGFHYEVRKKPRPAALALSREAERRNSTSTTASFSASPRISTGSSSPSLASSLPHVAQEENSLQARLNALMSSQSAVARFPQDVGLGHPSSAGSQRTSLEQVPTPKISFAQEVLLPSLSSHPIDSDRTPTQASPVPSPRKASGGSFRKSRFRRSSGSFGSSHGMAACADAPSKPFLHHRPSHSNTLTRSKTPPSANIGSAAPNGTSITTERDPAAQPDHKRQKSLGADPVVPSYGTARWDYPSDPAGQSLQQQSFAESTPRTDENAVGESSVAGTPSASATTVQRPNIKVRIITWNMHDSLPKGDLDVLLGKVGAYIPPESGWDISAESDESDSAEDFKDGPEDEEGCLPSGPEAGSTCAEKKEKKRKGRHVVGQEKTPREDRIPPLPYDDAHPYHIVVIAGQECPWGDGKRIATSVGMAGEIGDLTRNKSRAASNLKKEKERERERERAKEKEKPEREKEKEKRAKESSKPKVDPLASQEELRSPLEAPSNKNTGTGTGFPFGSPSSQIPGTPGMALLSPTLHSDPSGPPPTPGGTSLVEGLSERMNQAAGGLAAGWGIGGKGWSDICEDWFCKGPSGSVGKTLAKGPSPSMSRSIGLVQSPSKRDLAGPSTAPSTPDISREASPDFLLGPHATSHHGLFAKRAKKNEVPKLRLKIDGGSDSPSGSRPSTPVYSRSPSPADSPRLGADRSSQAYLSDVGALLTPPKASLGSTLAVPAPTFNRSSSSSTIPASKSRLGLGYSSADDDGLSTDGDLEGNVSVRSISPMPAPPSPQPQPRSGFEFQDPAQSKPETDGAQPFVSHSPAHSSGHNLISGPSTSDGTPLALGPYELVIKERMMGCYMAVYCWRGCKERIRGCSKAHVKSGLLSGRVGNKGGVGISVKLGQTRMLFVNAHLAAHEGKVAVRLANVAKIKAELKVDSFLPKDDPRTQLEDITEQFDHCFWFGDLNFRIDISRQHADWLLMQKRYDQALAFDQLRKVLAEGDSFRGFQEGPILFPPTYKFDVMKTLKAKRSRTVSQRILHRRQGSKGADSIAPAAELAMEQSSAPHKELDLTTTNLVQDSVTEEEEEEEEENEKADSSHDHPAIPEGVASNKDIQRRRSKSRRAAAAAKMERAIAAGLDVGSMSDDDASSVSSSAWGSLTGSSYGARLDSDLEELAMLRSSSRPSDLEREVERERIVSENTTAAQGPKVFSQGAAIKAKLKLIDFVKSATGKRNQSGLPSPTALKLSANRRRSSLIKTEMKFVSQDAMPTPPIQIPAGGPHVPGERRRVPDRRSSLGSNSSPIASTSGAKESDASSPVNSTSSGASLFSSPSKSSKSSVAVRAANPPEPCATTTDKLGGEKLDGNLTGLDGAPASVASSAGGFARRLTVVGRRGSTAQTVPSNVVAGDSGGESMARSASTKTISMAAATDASGDDGEAVELQAYDTSAKQRVPSWCDRVLFRSTVPIEEDEEEEPEESGNIRIGGERMSSRVGTVLSNVFTPMRQAVVHKRDASGRLGGFLSSNGPADGGSQSASVTFAGGAPRPPAEQGPLAYQKSRQPRRMRTFSNLTTITTTTIREVPPSPTKPRSPFHRFFHPRRQHAMKPTSTFDQGDHHQGGLSVSRNDLGTNLMTRAISAVDLPSQLQERQKEFGSTKEVKDHALLTPADGRLEGHGAFSLTKGIDRDKPGQETGVEIKPEVTRDEEPIHQRPTLPSRSPSERTWLPSISHPQGPWSIENEQEPNSIQTNSRRTPSSTSWWSDHISLLHLPSFLHPLRKYEKNQVEEGGKEEERKLGLVGPKRGRIECLLYKSLDDREMRILEGRSDHRPVIFVGAIGI